MGRINKLIYIILIIFLLLFTACSKDNEGIENSKSINNDTQTNSQVNLEINKKLEDLNYICETLEKKHKNLYANISKEDFIAEKNRIAELIETMDENEFYFSLSNLIALIGDAHTTISFSDSFFNHLSFLDFFIKKFDYSWVIIGLGNDNEKFLGSKLVAINDIPINKVFEEAKSIMSFDNLAYAEYQFSNLVSIKEVLNYLGISKNDEDIVLTVETYDGMTRKINTNVISESELKSNKIAKIEQSIKPLTAPEGKYRILALDKSNLYIQYNLCSEDASLPMKEFIKKVKQDISDNEYKKIIIDFRYNPGGNSSIFEPMIEMIKNMKSSKGFDVYTLISENTFSSGIINAVQTKKELESYLVGTPTGGSVNHFGEVRSFDLKNHSMTVYYSTKYFEMIKGYDKDSLYPDMLMTQTLEDYRAGIDTAIHWIINKDFSLNFKELSFKNVKTKLSKEQQKIFQDSIRFDEWKSQEIIGMGIIDDFILTNEDDFRFIFFDESNVFVIDSSKDKSYSFIIPNDIIKQLHDFSIQVTNEGINKGNEILNNQINEFNGLIVREPEELYDISSEDIYEFSKDELDELHNILNIEQWTVYTGNYQDINSDEDIPIMLHKKLYNEDMLLQVKKYGDLCIVKIRSYAGPTEEDYTFVIPEDTYNKLLDFKSNIMSD